MTREELFFWILWGALIIYSGVCIFVPEVRINWKGRPFKLGTVSSVGLAGFFWWPMVAALLVPDWPFIVVYLIDLVLFFGLTFVGYLMDEFPLKPRKRKTK